jgi:hypothetical protein
MTQHSWVQEGILKNAAEKVWCAAGYTNSQQIVEKDHKEKLVKRYQSPIGISLRYDQRQHQNGYLYTNPGTMP